MGKRGRPRKNQSPWVSTREILETLRCSRWHLYKLRDETFSKGYHYRDIRSNSSSKACYQWHVKRIEKTLNQAPELR